MKEWGMTSENSLGAPFAVTMGDACGIGPEIIAALAARGAARCRGGGDAAVLRRAVAAVGGGLAVALLDLAERPRVPPRCLPVWQPPGLPTGLVEAPLGQVDARAGAAAAPASRRRCARCRPGRRGRGDRAHPQGGPACRRLALPGHTEMLQALAGGVPVRMMLANEELRTVLVTIHVALREAIEQVTRDAVLQTLRSPTRPAPHGHRAPRIAVAG
jgi:4-hydroxythreonine-4-phosphate dehydrogenase